MKTDFKNIKEQLNRIKSLMGEGRLYGNLVDIPKIKPPMISENVLAAGKNELKAIWRPILKELMKGKGYVKIASKLSPGGKRTFFEIIEEGGEIIVKKNNKVIRNPYKIGNLVDSVVSDNIKQQVNNLKSIQELTDYFSTSGIINYKNHYKQVLDNLVAHNLISPKTKKELIAEFDKTDVMGILKHSFFPEGAGKGLKDVVFSAAHMKKKYPGHYSWLDMVPETAEQFLSVLGKHQRSPWFSNKYYDLIVSLTKSNDAWKNLKNVKISQVGDDQLLTFKFKDGADDIVINLNKVTEQEKRILTETITNVSKYRGGTMQLNGRNVVYNPNRNGGIFAREFDKVVNDIIEDGMDIASRAGKAASTESDAVLKMAQIEAAVANKIASNNLKALSAKGINFKNIWDSDLGIDWYYTRLFTDGFWQMGRRQKFLNWIKKTNLWAKWLNDTPVLRTIHGLFRLWYRRAFDIAWLQRTGRIPEGRYLDMIDAMFEVKLTKEMTEAGLTPLTKGKKGGGVLIETAEEAAYYNKSIGSWKPIEDISKRPDWKSNFKGLKDKEGNVIVSSQGQFIPWSNNSIVPFGSMSMLTPEKMAHNLLRVMAVGGAGWGLKDPFNWLTEQAMLFGANIKEWWYRRLAMMLLEYIKTEMVWDDRIAMMRLVFMTKCYLVIRKQFSVAFPPNLADDAYNAFMVAVGCGDVIKGRFTPDPTSANCLFWFDFTVNYVGDKEDNKLNMDNPVNITKSNMEDEPGGLEIKDVGQLRRVGGQLFLYTATIEDGKLAPVEPGKDVYAGTAIPLNCGGDCKESKALVQTIIGPQVKQFYPPNWSVGLPQDSTMVINTLPDDGSNSKCNFEDFIKKAIADFDKKLANPGRTMIELAYTLLDKGQAEVDVQKKMFEKAFPNITIDKVKQLPKTLPKTIVDKSEEIQDYTSDEIKKMKNKVSGGSGTDDF